jgi:hypothetical protein
MFAAQLHEEIMISPADLLAKAKAAPRKTKLDDHLDAINALRDKQYTWREIAAFLNENGIETDHSALFRFMQRAGHGFTVPAAAEYASVLPGILVGKGKLADNQMKMLERHYLAHNRTVTYTELANAVGSDDHRTANSQYGTLGKLVGEALDAGFELIGKREEPFYSGMLCVELQTRSPSGHIQMMMHHELAKAIESLGWFK